MINPSPAHSVAVVFFKSGDQLVHTNFTFEAWISPQWLSLPWICASMPIDSAADAVLILPVFNCCRSCSQHTVVPLLSSSGMIIITNVMFLCWCYSSIDKAETNLD